MRQAVANYQNAENAKNNPFSNTNGHNDPDEASRLDDLGIANEEYLVKRPAPPAKDPLMFPDLYSPSKFDIMSILVRALYQHLKPSRRSSSKGSTKPTLIPQIKVRQRPNPSINIGAIDSSVAVVLCSTTMPDLPIVYCSETFLKLTGYSEAEVLGRNCRFLQFPPSLLATASPPLPDVETQAVNNSAKKVIQQCLAERKDGQAVFINYRRSGERFQNVLTIIPIMDDGVRYVVGFQADGGTLLSPVRRLL